MSLQGDSEESEDYPLARGPMDVGGGGGGGGRGGGYGGMCSKHVKRLLEEQV